MKEEKGLVQELHGMEELAERLEEEAQQLACDNERVKESSTRLVRTMEQLQIEIERVRKGDGTRREV